MATSKIVTSSITDDAVTSGKIASGVVPTLRPNVNPLIINGDMAVAQRATQVTGYTSISYSTCDRWYTVCEIGTYTISQESLSDADFNTTGFRKALKLDCTTIEAPPSAGAQTNVEMRFEGQDLQVFQKGTANAKKYTLSFWVRASKTGSNLQVNFKDNDNTRMCSGTYNISSANTWEKKIINIAADTTGKFDNDNASSLTIEWFLDGGSNYSGGAVPTSWEAKNNADRNVTNFDLGGSTSNDWAITGVQLEVGEYTSSTIPPFQYESFGDNLHRCCRYFFYTGGGASYQSHGTGVEASSSTAAYCNIPLPNILRSSPTITKEDSLVVWDGNSENAITSLGNVYYAARGSLVNVACNCSGGGIDDAAGLIVYSSGDSTSGFLIDSEL